MRDIASTCHGYGYRRMTAELQHRGMRVNATNARRTLAENGLTPRQRRRYDATTDSDAATGSRQAERRWEPYNGKDNDSVKGEANRHDPASSGLRRHSDRRIPEDPWSRLGSRRRP
ncbi:MAG: transposase [Boseongicola sp. SB0677_bin_26]|nr:transposase [Boseongicola sp. SB0665_bin_10]MYG24729.1 transposase [Boseongicola sp. SB0677_bin_26]